SVALLDRCRVSVSGLLPGTRRAPTHQPSRARQWSADHPASHLAARLERLETGLDAVRLLRRPADCHAAQPGRPVLVSSARRPHSTPSRCRFQTQTFMSITKEFVGCAASN